MRRKDSPWCRLKAHPVWENLRITRLGRQASFRMKAGQSYFRKAGVDWVSLGPQRVGDEDLVEQAGVVMRELGPR